MDWRIGPEAGPDMLNVTAATRILVALDPVDMRQSFNGLYTRVQSVLQEEPTTEKWGSYRNY